MNTEIKKLMMAGAFIILMALGLLSLGYFDRQAKSDLVGIQEYHESLTQAQRAQSNIKYFMDPRTNLCFAGKVSNYGTAIQLTNVPCTPEVKTLIQPLP